MARRGCQTPSRRSGQNEPACSPPDRRILRTIDTRAVRPFKPSRGGFVTWMPNRQGRQQEVRGPARSHAWHMCPMRPLSRTAVAGLGSDAITHRFDHRRALAARRERETRDRGTSAEIGVDEVEAEQPTGAPSARRGPCGSGQRYPFFRTSGPPVGLVADGIRTGMSMSFLSCACCPWRRCSRVRRDGEAMQNRIAAADCGFRGHPPQAPHRARRIRRAPASWSVGCSADEISPADRRQRPYNGRQGRQLSTHDNDIIGHADGRDDAVEREDEVDDEQLALTTAVTSRSWRPAQYGPCLQQQMDFLLYPSTAGNSSRPQQDQSWFFNRHVLDVMHPGPRSPPTPKTAQPVRHRKQAFLSRLMIRRFSPGIAMAGNIDAPYADNGCFRLLFPLQVSRWR